MKALKISISGIRGIAGQDLSVDAVRRFAFACGSFLGGGRAAVATDARASRLDCFRAVCRGLLDSGCTPVSIGISPTPTLQLIIPESGASGGVCITASHNPAQWNGLKFYGADGILLDGPAMSAVIALFEKASSAPEDFCMPAGIEDLAEKARLHHITSVLKHIDVRSVRKRGFRVVVDSVNGAGGVVNEEFFKRLGCELISLNAETSGSFNRPPEPLPENLGGLGMAVAGHKADIGFAQDPDADRLAFAAEDGSLPGEDYTLALVVRHVLSKTPGPVVTNLSTSRVLDDICSEFKSPLIRTKIGERNVVGGMRESGSVIGGEGNGGVIYPAVHYGRDSLSGMGLMLEAMASSGKKISELLAEVPKYFIIKQKVEAGQILPFEKIKDIELFADAEMDLTDGVRASWDYSWAHVRGSGTEPVVRIIVENTDENSARCLYEKLMKAISA